MYGIPHGTAILGQRFFNIFPRYLLYFLEGTDMANYANDTTPPMLRKIKNV